MPPKKKPRVEKGQMSLLTSFGRSSAATTSTPSTEPDTDSASSSASRLTGVTEDKAQRQRTCCSQLNWVKWTMRKDLEERETKKASC